MFHTRKHYRKNRVSKLSHNQESRTWGTRFQFCCFQWSSSSQAQKEREREREHYTKKRASCEGNKFSYWGGGSVSKFLKLLSVRKLLRSFEVHTYIHTYELTTYLRTNLKMNATAAVVCALLQWCSQLFFFSKIFISNNSNVKLFATARHGCFYFWLEILFFNFWLFLSSDSRTNFPLYCAFMLLLLLFC